MASLLLLLIIITTYHVSPQPSTSQSQSLYICDFGEQHSSGGYGSEDDCYIEYDSFINACDNGMGQRSGQGSWREGAWGQGHWTPVQHRPGPSEPDDGRTGTTGVLCIGVLIVDYAILILPHSRTIHFACSNEDEALFMLVDNDREAVFVNSDMNSDFVMYQIVSSSLGETDAVYMMETSQKSVARVTNIMNRNVQLLLVCAEATEELSDQPGNGANLNCGATQEYSRVPGIDAWCGTHCNADHVYSSSCPGFFCACHDTFAEFSVTVSQQGVVQVYQDGVPMSVCGDRSWDDRAARVVCRELGSTGGAALLIQRYDTEREVRQLKVRCSGIEARLRDCTYKITRGDSRVCLSHHAAVSCDVATPSTTEAVTATKIDESSLTFFDSTRSTVFQKFFTSTHFTPHSSNVLSTGSSSKIIIAVVVTVAVLLVFAIAVALIIFVLLRKRKQGNNSDESTYSKCTAPTSITVDQHQYSTLTVSQHSTNKENVYTDCDDTPDMNGALTWQLNPGYTSNKDEENTRTTLHNVTATSKDVYTEPTHKLDHSKTNGDDDDDGAVVMTDNVMYISASHDGKGHNEGQYDDVICTPDQSPDRHDNTNSVYIENNDLYAASRT